MKYLGLELEPNFEGAARNIMYRLPDACPPLNLTLSVCTKILASCNCVRSCAANRHISLAFVQIPALHIALAVVLS